VFWSSKKFRLSVVFRKCNNWLFSQDTGISRCSLRVSWLRQRWLEVLLSICWSSWWNKRKVNIANVRSFSCVASVRMLRTFAFCEMIIWNTRFLYWSRLVQDSAAWLSSKTWTRVIIWHPVMPYHIIPRLETLRIVFFYCDRHLGFSTPTWITLMHNRTD